MEARRTVYRRSERGSFLLSVVLVALVIAGLSASALRNGLTDRVMIRHRETASKALEIAEVGLARAELEILALEDLDDNGIGIVQGAVGGGTFQVTAEQNLDYPSRWELVARGEYGQSVRRIAVGIRRRDSAYWLEGLFAQEDLTLSGGIATDSYDSRKGRWQSLAVNWDAGGRFAGTRGHVGSNRDIDISGTAAHVRGNAVPGPNSVTTIAGQPHIGDTVPRSDDIVLKAPPLEDFVGAYHAAQVKDHDYSNANIKVREDDGELREPSSSKKLGYLDKSFSLKPKGQTHVVLPGGTYFFTDLQLSGGATLEIAGPSKIYVTGNLELTGGGLVNPNGVPGDCQIFAHPYPVHGDSTPHKNDIRLEGGAQVAAAIYAPFRDVQVGGTGDVYGSLVGRNIKLNGDAYFHYDEALGAIYGVNEVFLERLYWNELGSIRR